MFILDNQRYNLETLYRHYRSGEKISIGTKAREAVNDSYQFLQEKLAESDANYYGINTGFGSLCDVRIGDDQIEKLQYNLLRSHACGAGDAIPEEIVRLILLLKVANLSKGFSGVQPAVIDKLVDFYNDGIHPVIYEYGSLGASGDLAPLAHMSLPLIGEGEVWHDSTKVDASGIVNDPIRLGAKDGLALINGTQFSTAFTLWSVMEGQRVLDWAMKAAALSIDVFGCRREPFDARIHEIRGQKGQITVAKKIRDLLEGSGLESFSGMAVQDPYAFRCTPQVLGASLQSLKHAKEVIEDEVNAVTDNPNVFAESDAILTGGNFHAQPVALIADYLAIALAEVANISERRLYQLIGGKRGLPSYLTTHAGTQSGFMILQYSAASIVSHNKQLCTPSSVDSIVSSQGQEDHVSMAANAAVKLKKVVENVERVIAMEWFTAMQALHFREVATSPALQTDCDRFRETVSPVDADRPLFKDVEKTLAFMQEER